MENSPTSVGKRPLLNIFWMISEKVIRLLVGITVGALVARHLGPSQFGILALVMTFATFSLFVSQFGMDRLVIKRLSEESASMSNIISAAIVLRLIFALVGIASVAFFIKYNPEIDLINNMWLYVMLIIPYLVFMSTEVFEYWYQSTTAMLNVSLSRIIGLIVASILKIYLIISNGSLLMFVATVIIESLIYAAAISLFFMKSSNSFRLIINWQEMLNLAKKTLPLGASLLAVFLYTRFDQIVIAKEAGSEMLGQYAAMITFEPLAKSRLYG
jgi:O-antigen/teichoic acid export membrane protein